MILERSDKMKRKGILTAVLCTILYFLITVAGIAKHVSCRAAQAVFAGVLAAILWFAFIRKINKKKG